MQEVLSAKIDYIHNEGDEISYQICKDEVDANESYTPEEKHELYDALHE